jgi:hypothetical protein
MKYLCYKDQPVNAIEVTAVYCENHLKYILWKKWFLYLKAGCT